MFVLRIIKNNITDTQKAYMEAIKESKIYLGKKGITSERHSETYGTRQARTYTTKARAEREAIKINNIIAGITKTDPYFKEAQEQWNIKVEKI